MGYDLLAYQYMLSFLRFGIFFVAFLFALALGAAIPERWFADKAALAPGVTKAEIYRSLPTRHRPIGELPAALAPAFKTSPTDLTIFVGEAYFADHCLNHHPDVPDSVYRRLDDILAAPDEIILDRREGRDAIILTKKLDGRLYLLVLRHYPPQVVYKTLFLADKARPYPALPRWKPSAQSKASSGKMCDPKE